MRPEQRDISRIPANNESSCRHRITRGEYERLMRLRRAERERQRRIRRNTFISIVLLLAAIIFIIIYFISHGSSAGGENPAVSAPSISSNETDATGTLVIPDWITVDLLPVNKYSRPGDKLGTVNGVVVHTTGNPGTTAEQNRSYYYNVSQTGETYVSSHFVIGIDGTVIQCVPLDEIAYCSNDRNADTISIECCHELADGKLSDEAYASLIKLTAWLCESFKLSPDDVIRHYDVTGKECPKYFTDHPEAWKAFLGELEK